MDTENYSIYEEMFSDVVRVNAVKLNVKQITLKVDLNLIHRYIKHIKKFSLVEDPYYLIEESSFYKEFEKYYIKEFNIKKEVSFDSTYLTYLEVLKSKIKIIQIEFPQEKYNFVYKINENGR